MQKISTCLWFDGNAEEAANFYVSIFPDSKITKIVRHGAAGPGKEGKVMTVLFTLDGHDYVALNGGPMFRFNEAVSLYVNCETQAEIDTLWDRLTADGGAPSQCGWLKDKYGLSWQIVPAALQRLFGDGDPAKANRVMKALLQMKKLDIAALERAAA